MIRGRSSVGTSVARNRRSWPLTVSEHSPFARKLRDQFVSPRGEHRYCAPPSSTMLIGVLNVLPDRRPRKVRIGKPPVRLKMGFITFLMNHGVFARTGLSGMFFLSSVRHRGRVELGEGCLEAHDTPVPHAEQIKAAPGLRHARQ